MFAVKETLLELTTDSNSFQAIATVAENTLTPLITDKKGAAVIFLESFPIPPIAMRLSGLPMHLTVDRLLNQTGFKSFQQEIVSITLDTCPSFGFCSGTATVEIAFNMASSWRAACEQQGWQVTSPQC